MNDRRPDQFEACLECSGLKFQRLLFALAVVCFGAAIVPEATSCRGDENVVAEIKEPKLAEELKVRFESDQAARKKITDFYAEHKIANEDKDLDNLDPVLAEKFKAIAKEIDDEDTRNRLWIKEVVAKHGWPGKSLVGPQAAIYAWLLAQHADSDREFQQQCLEKMEALPKGEVRPVDIAYLTDRVLSGTGKKQKYGTQVTLKDGKFIPQPIEDAEHVDERRKAIGLEPLADYLKMVEKVYSGAKE
jgi:hypothetical protein